MTSEEEKNPEVSLLMKAFGPGLCLIGPQQED
jgi:hypothetical protein